ncbi:MAG: hypothetical protein LBF74_12585, partial [Treponema sp.]|nr:hypothetical protein [Treponema sp.]
FFAFPKGTDKVIVDKFTAAVGDIAKNDSAYAKTIADAYSQTPVFYPGEEGFQKLDEAKRSIAQYQEQFRINK